MAENPVTVAARNAVPSRSESRRHFPDCPQASSDADARQPMQQKGGVGTLKRTPFLTFVLTLAVFGLADGSKRDESEPRSYCEKTYEIK